MTDMNGKPLRVDYVLAWHISDDITKEMERQRVRDRFHRILSDEGLVLEEVAPEVGFFQLQLPEVNCLLFQDSADGKTGFLKIHATWDVLAFYAEFVNLKKRIKVCSIACFENLWYEVKSRYRVNSLSHVMMN